MPDLVIGTAVLLEQPDGKKFLAVCCGRSDGGTFVSVVPCYEENETKPAEQAWKIKRVGPRLDVTPSLHVRYSVDGGKEYKTEFHNAGSWSVEFIVSKMAESKDHPFLPDPRIHEQCSSINEAARIEWKRQNSLTSPSGL